MELQENTVRNRSAEAIECDAERERRFRRLGIYVPKTLQAELKAQAKQPYLVEGLLRRQSVNLLVGDSGLGKTPLGIQLGVCVAAGLPFLDLKVAERGPVLYCDAESDLFGFYDTLESISRFLRLPEPPTDFHVWSPNWESQLDSLETFSSWDTKLMTRVQEVQPTLVIVDPLRMFWPQAETKSADAAAMIASLRKVSRSVRCSWLITHHRRKVNQQSVIAKLEENPHAWFQEAAGSHALVNQSDTRIGVVQHTGQADLLMAGFVRRTGQFVPLDLARVADDDGIPVGYRLLTGIEHLNRDDRAAFERLGQRFRFKDVQAAMGGGTSGSNAARFLKKCSSVQVIRKDGSEYVKSAPVVERVE